MAWWDPRALDLDREEEHWLRERDLLLVDDAAARPAALSHAAWQGQRSRTLDSGKAPSLRVETATARSLTADAAATFAQKQLAAVELAGAEGRDGARPRGKRFGILVHAVLAEVDLEAAPDAVTLVARAQARLVGASEEEVAAAVVAVRAALAHPLLRRAAAAQECRREEPLTHLLPDGTLLEGVVDLAFRDASGWTVVDFKTDAHPGAQPHYTRQLLLYCAAIEAATGVPARAALLAV